MAKHKVSELSGALLDAAVAKAEGMDFRMQDDACVVGVREFWPSGNWGDGGPLIERERLNVVLVRAGEWWAEPCDESFISLEGVTVAASPKGQAGLTPLIAAMRAYVASKMGEEVELP